MRKLIWIVSLCIISFNCAKPEDIAELTAPIAFAIANNAVKNGKQNGRIIVDLSFKNIEKKASDWPTGTIIANIQIPENNQKATVTYILNGTYTATAIVELEGKDRKQYPINFIESAVIFGQAQTIENHFKRLGTQLMKNLPSSKKIAIFDGVGVNNESLVFGKSLSESLVTQFSGSSHIIVERRLLDSVLKEVQFQREGLTSDEIRVKLGEFLGADTIVVSTIKGSKSEVVINSRSIDIKTGIISSSAQEILPRYLIQSSDQKGLD
ncbi:MAG: FlgO family outer membrane protein [Leptospira sp.]|nr:FlgO family outer membrane protein [Leptospira sp.]